MKYGLVINDQIICEPISDHSQLLNIAKQKGAPVSDTSPPLSGEITLEREGRLFHLWPAEEKFNLPPADIGFATSYSAWTLDKSSMRITRECRHSPMTFSETLKDLRRHIRYQRDVALSRIETACAANGGKVWARQQAEAAAWLEDNTTPVPMIQKLANRGGVTVAVVVQKIASKAAAANNLTTKVMDDVLAAEKKIKALKAMADANSLPDSWLDQLQYIAGHWRNNWPPELL
ncbi:hypothetical protein [Oceanospirillum sediminis]|uniref:Uncharacterized protein n=1 Tax=Oceanospirillum sediminis TaxID=2760088 RepID=A0A839ILH2_9GAMM|nr:hypothetical protein [Oceanospirillum sediminis]MBB1486065.1 hypothetical protein [Oceanospirillum sediminis]